MKNPCFHCGEAIPDNLNLLVEINNKAEAMCCYGCEAVARQLVEFGLTDYYRHRTNLPETPQELVPEELKKLSVFDDPQVQSEFVSSDTEHNKEVKLIIEGISCPACTWLIESRLTKLHGIKQVSLNYSTQRCRVVWQEDEVTLSKILESISQLGYSALPYNHKQRELLYENERKSQLLRLGIAGLFGMQVMMIAIALYFGDASGIEDQYRIFFNWVSLLLTLPVLMFSGKPLFSGALRDLRNKRLGMDVPITLGLSIAFFGSLWSILQQNGHVYFDSIVMFIFFILGGRYLEFMSRKKSTAYLDKTTSILPPYATRINNNDEQEVIKLSKIAVSDHVLVKPGEVIPIDGVIYQGHSSVDESIVTGESLPIEKKVGSKVIGGSTNNESPLYIRVESIGERTLLSNIARIIDKASRNKPATILLANKIVSIFIAFVILIAFVVGFYWYSIDPAQWLTITISVLVVSCPCALSLATPTALSSAATALMQNGVALLNNDSIEKITKSNCFVFDKTGTLTKGKLKLEHVKVFNEDFSEEKVLKIASALESASEHPLAKAICDASNNDKPCEVTNIKNFPGQGISGFINETWFIGTEPFVKANISENNFQENSSDLSLRKVYLANTDAVIAILYFTDELRKESADLIIYLTEKKKKIILMSGDHHSIVKQLADTLGINEFEAPLRPENKHENINKLQKDGFHVCMIGDGINDAPAFAQSDVAIAMTEASDITKLNADMLLLNNNIGTLKTMLQIAGKTNRTVKINFAWALAYNLTALPFAILGYITPWMAALGMSLSSLIIVINASKITSTDYS